MDLEFITSLIKLVSGSTLTSLELELEDGQSIRLSNKPAEGGAPAVQSLSAAQAPAVDNSAQAAPGESINSPMVGVFHTREAMGLGEPLPGEELSEGTVIGAVEAMKMINEIEVPAKCVFEGYLAKNGQSVEFGQPLVKIRGV